MRSPKLVNDNYSSPLMTIRISHWQGLGDLDGVGQRREGEARPELTHPVGA